MDKGRLRKIYSPNDRQGYKKTYFKNISENFETDFHEDVEEYYFINDLKYFDFFEIKRDISETLDDKKNINE